MNEECIFCKIVNGKAPATVEGENEHAMAFRSIDPVAEHHILIVPKKHIAHFDDISKEDGETVLDMVNLAQRLVSELKTEGYKLAVNGGSYQVVPHLHWHLLTGKFEDKDALNKI